MDAILQMYASTLGSGVSNSAAFVDVPQGGRIRKIQFIPVVRGIFSGAGTDFSMWYEVSTLPTNRMYNNGDYGNIFARAGWNIESGVTTSGAGSAVISGQEVTGLDYRIVVGLRIFLHVYMSATPAAADEHVINLYIDA